MSKNLVAVYGSLRSGMGNYRHFLDNNESTLIGSFETDPIYTMISFGGFPGLFKEGETSVVAEVFEVSDRVFSRLDMLEGYDESDPDSSMYKREKINTPHGEAWIYFYNGNRSKINEDNIVKEGDWVKYKNA